MGIETTPTVVDFYEDIATSTPPDAVAQMEKSVIQMQKQEGEIRSTRERQRQLEEKYGPAATNPIGVNKLNRVDRALSTQLSERTSQRSAFDHLAQPVYDQLFPSNLQGQNVSPETVVRAVQPKRLETLIEANERNLPAARMVDKYTNPIDVRRRQIEVGGIRYNRQLRERLRRQGFGLSPSKPGSSYLPTSPLDGLNPRDRSMYIENNRVNPERENYIRLAVEAWTPRLIEKFGGEPEKISNERKEEIATFADWAYRRMLESGEVVSIGDLEKGSEVLYEESYNITSKSITLEDSYEVKRLDGAIKNINTLEQLVGSLVNLNDWVNHISDTLGQRRIHNRVFLGILNNGIDFDLPISKKNIPLFIINGARRQLLKV